MADKGNDDKRSDLRYQVRFPVQLGIGRRTWTFFTEDVSRRGLFVRTDTEYPLRELLRLQLVLPPGQHAIRGHGMVVHKVPRGPGRTTGIGLQLYGWDRETQMIWEQFVAQVARCCPESADQAPLDAVALDPQTLFTPTPTSRRVRHTTVLLVETRTIAELEAIYRRDIVRGVTSIETREGVAVGAEVLVNVRHPETDQHLLLDGVVKERHEGTVIVSLVRADERARHDFLDFVRGGVNVDSVPRILAAR